MTLCPDGCSTPAGGLSDDPVPDLPLGVIGAGDHRAGDAEVHRLPALRVVAGPIRQPAGARHAVGRKYYPGLLDLFRQLQRGVFPGEHTDTLVIEIPEDEW